MSPISRTSLTSRHVLILCAAFLMFTHVTSLASSEGNIRDDPKSVPGGSVDKTRSSPFDPQQPRDDIFVTDSGRFLDTGCTFRNGGPLLVDVEIDRVVGPVDSQGFLLNWSDLVQNKVISRLAIIRMPAFDVDFVGGGGFFNPERDLISLNGQVIDPNNKYLTGANNVWKLNSFVVETNRLKFPADPGDGRTPTPVRNQIRIDIDTQNAQLVWCTAIDWVEISFSAARPVLMVHGILSNGGTWSNQWEPELTGREIINEGAPNPSRDRQSFDLGGFLGIPLDSIQNNAGKIAGRAGQMQARYGVDRINIASHSKGGIDSRHFAEVNSSVDRLYQIGTPNAGSPLADYIQGIGTIFTPIPTAILNTFAGPAGRQLTTWHMTSYNRVHGFNPNVEYNAIAGVYDGRTLLDPIDSLLNAIIPGDDDTIVPSASVYALSYTRDFPAVRSSGTNTDGKHTSQANTQASPSPYFSAYIGGLTSAGRPLPALGGPPPPAERTKTVGGTIIQGQLLTDSLVIDGGGRTWISLLYDQGDLDLAIVKPDGTRIDRGNFDTFSGVGFGAAETTDGLKWKVFELLNPDAGSWGVEVTGVLVEDISGEEAWHVTGWFEAPQVRLQTSLTRQTLSNGEQIVVNAVADNAGSPVLDSQFFATFGLPDDSTMQVQLADDGVAPDAASGDGIFSGAITASQSGFYRIHVAAQGSSALPFSREAFLLASASSVSGGIVGNYTDRGADSNGNGLFEALEIGVDVSVSAPAEVAMIGVLTDMNGDQIASTTAFAPLAGGTSRITLVFDGQAIAGAPLDGPYTLHSVRLAQDLPPDRFFLAEGIDEFQTQRFLRSDFERPAIFFTKNGADRAFDDDGNEKIDRLEVDAEVQIRFAGFYNWSGALADPTGRELDFHSSSGFLSTGPNTLTFRFEGNKVGAAGVDGPYSLSNVLVNGQGQGAVGLDVFTTFDYKASQFEGFVATNQPPFADAGPDHTAECEGPMGTNVELDGSQSTDPDGDPISFLWEATGVTFDDPTSTMPLGLFPLGMTAATVTVTDPEGLSDSDDAIVTILDTLAPTGIITFPSVGQCFGPAELPVTVTDDFTDMCDGAVSRIYDPAGGPEYSNHGNLALTLKASDSSGNETSRSVLFVIDTAPPRVDIMEPADGVSIPGDVPFDIMFQAHDGDGATGAVLHEQVLLNDCVIYDGAIDGDGDGLLRDEILHVDVPELCRVSALCGFSVLNQPVLHVEATDCGGNIGTDVQQFRGDVALSPGLCGFQ